MPETTHPPTPAATLRALQRAHDAEQATGADLTAKVLDARRAGAPVEALAEALGMKQSNVSRDYLSHLEPGEREILAGLRYKPAPPAQWATAMRAVRRAAGAHTAAQANVPVRVAAARQAGVLWKDIAAVLGKAVSNTMAKYQPMLKVDTHTTVTLVEPAKTARAKRST